MNGTALQELLDSVDEQQVVALLSDMVDISSPTGEERPLAEYLVGYLAERGFRTCLQEVEEHRANAIGWLPGGGDGPSLMFNGHLDTSVTGVEAEDYPATGPLTPGFRPQAEVRDGRVYGLGAFNMKAGVAASIVALDVVRRSGVPLSGDLLVSGVCGEIDKAPVNGALRSFQGRHYRGAGWGARYLVTHGFTSDYVIETEPSGLFVSNARTGYLLVKVTARGQLGYVAAKGPRFQGINAVEKAARLVEALAGWEETYRARHALDTGLGIINPNLMIGAIEGGWPYKPGFCPAICNVYLDLRLAPGMGQHQALAELREVLARVSQDDGKATFDVEVFCSTSGSITPADHPLVRLGLWARELVLGEPQARCPSESMSASSDANVFRQHGIPAIGCGPGGSDGSERPGSVGVWDEGENVSIAQLVSAVKVYVAAAVRLATSSSM